MSKPNSVTDVYNLSLDLLNQNPITSNETSSRAAAFFNRWGDHIRRVVLRMHAWNFATKRVTLAADSAPPAYEYDKAFSLPNDFVRLASVGETGEIRNYQLEGNKILVYGNETALPLKYIFDMKNVLEMDALFIEVWALELAVRAAKPLTADATRAEELKRDLQMLRGQAFAIDGQERPPVMREVSKYKDRRLSGSTSGYSSGRFRT